MFKSELALKQENLSDQHYEKFQHLAEETFEITVIWKTKIIRIWHVVRKFDLV